MKTVCRGFVLNYGVCQSVRVEDDDPRPVDWSPTEKEPGLRCVAGTTPGRSLQFSAKDDADAIEFAKRFGFDEGIWEKRETGVLKDGSCQMPWVEPRDPRLRLIK